MAVAKDPTSSVRCIIDCQKFVPGDEPAPRTGGPTESSGSCHRASSSDVQESTQQRSRQRPTHKRNGRSFDLRSVSTNRRASLPERDCESIRDEQETPSPLLQSPCPVSRRDHGY